ncbi:5327_t:CDS:2 [Diversispora eburnea]|uniref:5327_t:CDS:1 n=1 Tax=Diversispora eburnea TaxID=1213867 RepID=A0A9N9A1L2_9GLOM|nr:5327_t:CDS:2 [Diversispora eburnea]
MRRPYPTLVVKVEDTESVKSLHELVNGYFFLCTTIQIYLVVKLFPPYNDAIIDPKSHYSNISKALAEKIDCYISRDFGGSRFRQRENLVLNHEKSLSISLGESHEHFLVLDKLKYELVLDERWLDQLYNIWYNMKKFYDLLFPDDTLDFKIPSNLDEYYDSSYSETESETDSISSDSNDSKKSSKKRATPTRLTKHDVDAILYAKDLKAQIKSKNARNNNPDATSQEIVIPEKTKLSPKDFDPEIAKQDEIKQIFRSEISRSKKVVDSMPQRIETALDTKEQTFTILSCGHILHQTCLVCSTYIKLIREATALASENELVFMAEVGLLDETSLANQEGETSIIF